MYPPIPKRRRKRPRKRNRKLAAKASKPNPRGGFHGSILPCPQTTIHVPICARPCQSAPVSKPFANETPGPPRGGPDALRSPLAYFCSAKLPFAPSGIDVVLPIYSVAPAFTLPSNFV